MKRLSLKQKDSCKYYKLFLGDDNPKNKLPNIVDIFDLWPYFMYYNTSKNADLSSAMVVYDYQFPLGADGSKPSNSDLSVYFDRETLEMRQFTVKAKSLNITNPAVFTVTQPITTRYYGPEDLEYPGLNCTQGSDFEQERLNYYITRIVDIIFNKD